MDLFNIKQFGILYFQIIKRDQIFIQNQHGQEVDFMEDHGHNHYK